MDRQPDGVGAIPAHFYWYYPDIPGKVLNKKCGVKKFELVSNMVESEAQGRQLYSKVSRVADRFLDVSLGYLGAVPRDDYLRRSVQQQTPVVQLYPRSKSAQALVQLARNIDANASDTLRSGGLGFFLERLIRYRSQVVEV